MEWGAVVCSVCDVLDPDNDPRPCPFPSSVHGTSRVRVWGALAALIIAVVAVVANMAANKSTTVAPDSSPMTTGTERPSQPAGRD